jgi:magnesium-transporting ATPase (P-type)
VEEIHHNNLQVGDVILVELGMKIPVDGICLEANELKCDESAMTGESDHLKKDTVEVCLKKIEEAEMEWRANKNAGKFDHHEIPSPLLMSGTAISEGDGKMMAIVVGEISALGIIRKSLEDEQ